MTSAPLVEPGAWNEPETGSTETTRVSRVIYGIRNMIKANGLRTGDVLPSESAVGEALGVSRAVVREAFQSMDALSIIDVGNGRRARVAKVDPEVLALVVDHGVQTDQVSIQQILDVRRTIELRTAGLAAVLRSEAEAREIERHAAGMRRQFADAERVMESDIAFHGAIARASKNAMFALLVGSFHVVTRQTWHIGWRARRSDEHRLHSVVCHEEIAAAIVAHDRDRAEMLMADHFDETVKMLLDSGIN